MTTYVQRQTGYSVKEQAMTIERVKKGLPEDIVVEYYERTGSTNDDAKRLFDMGIKRAVVIAGTQCSGRGQSGKSFASDTGGLYMSMLFSGGTEAKYSQLITAAAGVSVYRALEAAGVYAEIKYPNDIYSGGKKLAGILTESRSLGDKLLFSVTGAGINISNDVGRVGGAVSLEGLGVFADIELLASAVASNFFVRMQTISDGNADSIATEYNGCRLMKDYYTSAGQYAGSGIIDILGRLIEEQG